MPNELYQQMNAGKTQGDPMGDTFVGFMAQMRGQNPRQIIDQMVKSGKITQQQLNQAQQKAQEMSGMFGKFRNMFGF
ncbi:MAG: hypothetical protein IJ302_01670 [Clostridia bacterium]|nr:hypothetical protein [Clostridia bacterium]